MPANTTYTHTCAENDNIIKLYVEEIEPGKDDVELLVSDALGQDTFIVGLKDLETLLSQAGYTITKKPTPASVVPQRKRP